MFNIRTYIAARFLWLFLKVLPFRVLVHIENSPTGQNVVTHYE
jgi:hypothetical protein